MNSNCAVFGCTITNRYTTMDTKALRQKILDLAIHGKLVPQDPNDEPASVLLERIKAEKERLIKEGKIKRSKKSAKSSDTPHYEQVLPNGWYLSTLGEVFTLQAGKNITAKEIKDTATESHSYKCYGGNGIRGFVASYNREGDFPIIGRQGALCGNINIAKGKFYATEHAVVVERYCDVDLMWAYYTLTTLNLNKYATATAQPGLSVAVINNVYIPIPPQKEQERISQEIEHWFALIEQIEQGKADLQTTIKQTKNRILDLAIHGKLVPQDPNDEPAIELLKRINPDFTPCDNGHRRKLPQGWAYCQLSNVFKITMGQSPKGDSLNNKRGIEFHQGKICFSDKFLLESGIFTNEPTKIAEPNSILLCVRAPVGGVNITKNQICIGRGLCALTPFEGNADFYFYLLQTLQDSFDNQSTGTTFKAISGEIIKNENIILPPLAEQQRIVQKIEELFHVLDNIQKALEV